MKKQLQLILSKTFFEWYTLHSEIAKYRKILSENIFSLIELMKMAYNDIVNMPVKRFYDLIKWKSDLEDERQKLMKEHEDKMKSAQKQRKK